MVVTDDRDASQQVKNYKRVQNETYRYFKTVVDIKHFMDQAEINRKRATQLNSTHRLCIRSLGSKNRRETRKSFGFCK